MTRQKVRDTIETITVKQIEKFMPCKFDRNKTFNDLGADEFDVVAIQMGIEYALKIEFDDYESEGISTPAMMETFICGRFGVSN